MPVLEKKRESTILGTVHARWGRGNMKQQRHFLDVTPIAGAKTLGIMRPLSG